MAKKQDDLRPIEIEAIKQAMLAKSQPKNNVPVGDLLGLGSTLANLGCSGKVFGAFAKGTYNLIVGDTNSGKSIFATAIMAEACLNPAFDGYDLIYDDVERAMLMNKERFFGKKAAERIKAPDKEKDGTPIYSNTVEDMYRNVWAALQRKKPFVYVVDSETSLSCEADVERAEAEHKKHKKGEATTVAGTYGTEKAKVHSSKIRLLMGPLADTGSILVIINQTRDNIGFGAQFNPKTRPGGNALEFFATVQMWLSVRQKLTTTFRGNKVEQGILSKIKIKRSRLTGRQIEVEVPIYWSTGIDDVGSMVDWLVEWKHWGIKEKEIEAPEFNFTGNREALVKRIQGAEQERDLQNIVAKVWDQIEAAVSVERKSRYE